MNKQHMNPAEMLDRYRSAHGRWRRRWPDWRKPQPEDLVDPRVSFRVLGGHCSPGHDIEKRVEQFESWWRKAMR